jgi:hypothetical protein
VIGEQRRLLQRVIARHDLPLDATLPGTIRNAAVAAKWSYDEEHGGGPAPDPWDELEDELDIPDSTGSDTSNDDEPDGNDACYDGCAAQAAALAASALAAYVAALAACTAAGPFWPVCWAGATATYVIALYEMDAVVDRCVANCGGGLPRAHARSRRSWCPGGVVRPGHHLLTASPAHVRPPVSSPNPEPSILGTRPINALRRGLDPAHHEERNNQSTPTTTRLILNNASGHGPRDGSMVVANRLSHHRGTRHVD